MGSSCDKIRSGGRYGANPAPGIPAQAKEAPFLEGMLVPASAEDAGAPEKIEERHDAGDGPRHVRERGGAQDFFDIHIFFRRHEAALDQGDTRAPAGVEFDREIDELKYHRQRERG